MATPASPAPGQITLLLALIEGWKAIQLTDYLHTGGLMMIVADYLQTFPDEVRLMWPSTAFNLPRLLFFALRYGIFVQRIIVYYYVRLYRVTATHCHWVFFSAIMSSCLILLASEAVLFVRVYAFSGRKRSMLIYLTLQFLVLAASTFTLLAFFGKDVQYIDGLSIPICLPISLPDKLLGSVYMVTFSNLLVVMLIMVYLARREHPGINSTLFTVFYRDGMLYFACISAFAILNSIMGFLAPVRYKFLFTQIETDLHAILATRMLLHLREQANRKVIVQGDPFSGESYYLSDITSSDQQLQCYGRQGGSNYNSVQVTSTVWMYTS